MIDLFVIYVCKYIMFSPILGNIFCLFKVKVFPYKLQLQLQKKNLCEMVELVTSNLYHADHVVQLVLPVSLRSI